jgi:stress-induced morphogen
MSDHPTDFVGSVEDAITSSVKDRIPDAVVAVSVFAGKSMLENQRLVLSAIKHLINGDRAPVHAVDELTTRTP